MENRLRKQTEGWENTRKGRGTEEEQKMSLEEKVLSYIRSHSMLEQGQRVVVGLSGGADSVCLLSLLTEFKKEYQLELRAVHVHHGLRGGEADRDASFSESLCRSLSVPFCLISANVKEEAKQRRVSEEEAGRMLRYEAFEKEARQWKQELREKGCAELDEDGKEAEVKIAVAHHGDDSAETILYQLFRGSGLKGLSGIPPVRDNIIRPLLCAERKEITDYLEEKGLSFVTDSTNLENDYARNKIRNQLLPMAVQEINQGAAGHIRKAGELIGEANRFFEERAEGLLDMLLETEDSETGQRTGQKAKRASLSASGLLSLAHIEAAYTVQAVFKRKKWPLKDITSGHIESVLSLLKGRTGAGVDLPGGLRAERSYDRLIFTKLQPGITEKMADTGLPSLCMEVADRENQGEIPKNLYTKWFDYDRIKDTLSVRYRLPGDYITLKGGGTKSLKSLFIDEKIPREERGRIPLLAEGSHVLWVIGGRISEYYKVTEETERILKVQVDGGINCG